MPPRKPLTHEQLAARIRQLDEEARRENWSPRTRALGYALGIARMFNVGQILKDIRQGLTPEAIAQRGEKLKEFNRRRVDTVTPEQLVSLGQDVGGAFGTFAHKVAQRDPETLGTIASVIAPSAASRIFGATPAGRLAARTAASAAERAAIGPNAILPQDWTALSQQVRVRGGRATPVGNLNLETPTFQRAKYTAPESAPNTSLDVPTFMRRGQATPHTLSNIRSRFRTLIGGGEALPRVKTVNEPAANQMAQTYEGLKSEPNSPEVRSAYDAFNRETQAQADALHSAGYTWDFVDHDPYPPSKGGSKAMLRDLRENHHISVYKTAGEQGHPLMTNDQNNLFRAVHEFLGHGVDENSFSAVGEENAFRSHAQMYSPEARPVMATETRGQNSWFNYGPHKDVPAPQRPFAVQKAALWPTDQLGDYKSFPTERIAAPTVKGANGQYYAGANHDLASEAAAEAQRATPEGMAAMERNGGSAIVRGSEGFKTTTGRQITREEARGIAGATGQAPKLAPQYTQLHSSDISNPNNFAGEHPVPHDLIAPAVLGGQFKGLDELLPYLMPDEIARVLSPRGVLLRNSINERAALLGPDDPLVAAALQGQLARGGYESVLPELRARFGPDAERFAGIWASVSPRQLNENALGMASDIYGRWRELGGLASDPNALAELARTSELPARVPNTLAALTAQDPRALALGGNKVASFFPNLLGDLNPVTLDGLQAAGMGINPARFGNYGSYLTGSAQVRRVAGKLGAETGTPWAPAQAQEGMWATIRAMMNLPGADKAMAGGALPELASQVSPEMAGAQWGPQVFRDILSEGGAMGSDVPPALPFPLGNRAALRRLAETIQNAARKRYRF
jgi:hypothetical protein